MFIEITEIVITTTTTATTTYYYFYNNNIYQFICWAGKSKQTVLTIILNAIIFFK